MRLPLTPTGFAERGGRPRRTPTPSLAPVLALVASLAGAADAAEARRPADHVIVVVLDGTRPDALRRAQAPAIQGLARDGASFLQAETVYPSQTRVAFVTLPTGAYGGSHGIVGGDALKDASWQTVDVGDADPIKAQSLVARPTFFEEATAAGLTSLYAALKGYELVGARGATWTINGKQSVDRAAYAARYVSTVGGSADLALWHKQQLSRQILDQSLAIIKDKRPNLVVMNLGSADYVAHTYGPESPHYVHTIQLVDGLVGELMTALKGLGVLERTAFIVTADHGFSEADPALVVAPRGPDGSRRIKVLSDMGVEHFVTNSGGASMGVYVRDKTRLGRVIAALKKEPWCEAIYCEGAKTGCDRTLSELHAYFPGRSPDLMVDLDDDAVLDATDPGQHGSHRPGDMHIPLILSGAGVARGVVLGKASLVDVAPTALRLLGIRPTLLKPDGRVLEEALAP